MNYVIRKLLNEKTLFLSMEKNSNSRAMHMMPSFTVQSAVTANPPGREIPLEGASENEKLKQLEGKLFIGSLSFKEKVGAFGLRTVLKSYLVRYRYILGLWLLRESAILIVLSQNYEEVQGLWSKILARPFVSSRLVTLFKRLSAMLLHRSSIQNLSVVVRTDNNTPS